MKKARRDVEKMGKDPPDTVPILTLQDAARTYARWHKQARSLEDTQGNRAGLAVAPTLLFSSAGLSVEKMSTGARMTARSATKSDRPCVSL